MKKKLKDWGRTPEVPLKLARRLKKQAAKAGRSGGRSVAKSGVHLARMKTIFHGYEEQTEASMSRRRSASKSLRQMAN